MHLLNMEEHSFYIPRSKGSKKGSGDWCVHCYFDRNSNALMPIYILPLVSQIIPSSFSPVHLSLYLHYSIGDEGETIANEARYFSSSYFSCEDVTSPKPKSQSWVRILLLQNTYLLEAGMWIDTKAVPVKRACADCYISRVSHHILTGVPDISASSFSPALLELSPLRPCVTSAFVWPAHICIQGGGDRSGNQGKATGYSTSHNTTLILLPAAGWEMRWPLSWYNEGSLIPPGRCSPAMTAQRSKYFLHWNQSKITWLSLPQF